MTARDFYIAEIHSIICEEFEIFSPSTTLIILKRAEETNS